MSPLEIEIMLHYYWSPDDYRAGQDNQEAPAVLKALYKFQRLSMLTPITIYDPSDNRAALKITKKGVAYVMALKAVEPPSLCPTCGTTRET